MAGNERGGGRRKGEKEKRRRMMLLLRRRKSDHSPPFFSAKALRVNYIPQLHQYYRAHFHRERSSQEERWNGEGREKGVFGGGGGFFFSRGESVHVYSPMFLGVRREKRKGLYVRTFPNRILFSAADVRN